LLNHLAVESRDIRRLPAGHETVIDHHLLIDPFGIGVFQIGLDGAVGGQSSSLNDARVDECPWAMANRGDWLALIKEGANELHGLWIGAKFVRAHDAARQEQRIKLARIGLIERDIDRKRLAPIGVTPAFYLLAGR